MEPGEKCICQEDDWCNAFGESNFSVSRGMRLVVKDSMFVAGTKFLSFEETPVGLFYMSIGFTPLRNYN
jgi:hypothetical protein